MSHFNVMVMTTDDSLSIEELLEPYYEGNRRAPWIEFSRQGAIDYVREHYPKFKDKTDNECWQYMAEDYKTIDKDGNLYATYNPDARLDYWLEGGRWNGQLLLKDGTRANSAKIKDIDFSLNQEEYKRALRFWDIIVNHKPLEPDEKKPFNLWNDEYYREFYGTRENYARRHASFHTHAVVTSDGLWLEPGEVGWFGMDNSTPESARDWEDNFLKNFIEGEDPETTITIVDCHI